MHGFLDSLNPISSCGLDIETTCHYLLRCSNFINEKTLPLTNVLRITKDKYHCGITVIKFLLYGDNSLDSVTDTLILNASVGFILSRKRFNGALL